MKKLLKRKSKALSLVEIVVAIGVSVITLTTSTIFSTRVITSAQQNFMEDSSVQLSNVIVEQFRLAEIEMQNTKAKVISGQPSTPRVFSSAADWTTFCNTGTGRNLFIDTPKAIVNSNDFNYKITFPAGAVNADVGGVSYFIQEISDKEKLTGAFYAASASTVAKVGMGILKTIENQTFGQIINLSVVIRYYVLKNPNPNYTNPIQIRMIRDTICL
jgi:hypothetical protein